MNGTLLLRLAGPLQSWGDAKRHRVMGTRDEPTKSGVVGLICQAIGRDFSEDVSDLARLVMTVRADREGGVMRDYHVCLGVPTAAEDWRKTLKAERAARRPYFGEAGERGGSKDPGPKRLLEDRRMTRVTERYYLEDAHFLIALEGPLMLLSQIEAGIAAPARILSLGRKACLPGRPVWVQGGLIPGARGVEVLSRWPWERPQPGVSMLRLVVDLGLAATRGEPCMDWPISLERRTFASRRIETAWVPVDGLDAPGLDAPVRSAN